MTNWSCNCIGPKDKEGYCPCVLELIKNNNIRQPSITLKKERQ